MPIRHEQAGDRVEQLQRTAFGGHGHGAQVAELVAGLRRLIDQQHGLSLVAESGGSVVGHLMCTPAILDAPREQDPNSSLSHRLRLIRAHLHDWLDGRRGQALTAISACAGQGHDLIGVLATRPDGGRVQAVLLESDPRNVAAARLSAAVAGLDRVQVRQADAGRLASYADAVPADLVLLAGVFGNISEHDIRRTIGALPQLCATGASVLWTRSRRTPDLTPSIREWFAEAGLREQAFDAPAGELIAVGVHRYFGRPQPLDEAGELFRFRDP